LLLQKYLGKIRISLFWKISIGLTICKPHSPSQQPRMSLNWCSLCQTQFWWCAVRVHQKQKSGTVFLWSENKSRSGEVWADYTCLCYKRIPLFEQYPERVRARAKERIDGQRRKIKGECVMQRASATPLPRNKFIIPSPLGRLTITNVVPPNGMTSSHLLHFHFFFAFLIASCCCVISRARDKRQAHEKEKSPSYHPLHSTHIPPHSNNEQIIPRN
jgi:hypothetical protein